MKGEMSQAQVTHQGVCVYVCEGYKQFMAYKPLN